MTTIQSIEQLYSLFTFPFIGMHNNKRIESMKISIEDLSQGKNQTFPISLKYIPNESIIPACTFEQLGNFIDESSRKDLKKFIENVYSSSNLYKTSLMKCTIDYVLTANNNSVPLSVSRYFVIPTIDISLYEKNIFCSLNIEREKARIKILLNNDNYESYVCKTILRTTYNDMVIYEDMYVKENMIERNLSINNYEATELYIIIIAKNLTTKEIETQFFSFPVTTILLPNIQYTPQETKIEGNIKLYEFMVKILCNVYNGIEYVDYSSWFLKYGFKLSSDNNDVKFRVNKNITKNNL